MNKKSHYYNKYINEIKDAIIDGKRELNFKDGNCDIIIRLIYDTEKTCEYHKSPHPYDIPSEKEYNVVFKNIIVEIETFEDFALPNMNNSWSSFER